MSVLFFLGFAALGTRALALASPYHAPVFLEPAPVSVSSTNSNFAHPPSFLFCSATPTRKGRPTRFAFEACFHFPPLVFFPIFKRHPAFPRERPSTQFSPRCLPTAVNRPPLGWPLPRRCPPPITTLFKRRVRNLLARTFLSFFVTDSRIDTPLPFRIPPDVRSPPPHDGPPFGHARPVIFSLLDAAPQL